MRKSDKRIALIITSTLLSFIMATNGLAQSSGGNYRMTSSVVSGGGGASTGSGNKSIEGTSGQAAAGGPQKGSSISHVSGFWPTTLAQAAPTPQGGGPITLQFSSSAYHVGEGDLRVDINVTRSGDTSSAVSVGYATGDAAGLQNCNVTNGIASPRCDYIVRVGTLQFASGETTKLFSVPIIDDSYAEGAEAFTVSLSNPSGGTLGALFTATVTINDNDNVTGPNPIDNPDFFVRQQYLDFLGREPDPPGFAGWTGTIINCAPGDTNCDRIHVSSLFYQSAEFQQRGSFVYRFYPVGLARKPNYSEFIPDLARLSGFLSSAELEAARVAFANDFVARPEFIAKYGALNNQNYIDAVLLTAGLNLPGRQAMIDGLNSGVLTRAAALRQIAESPEASQKYYNQAFAVMEYFGYLRRDPDSFYLNWIQVLDGGADARVMVSGFMNSQEYRQRFGP